MHGLVSKSQETVLPLGCSNSMTLRFGSIALGEMRYDLLLG